MAVFKATQNKRDSAGKFKATKNRSYDSTLVYDWETRNKESYDALEKYRQRINSGGYLSADDLTAYRKALDSYVETSTSLRGFSKAMGHGKDDDDAWTKTIADMESGYKGISDYFSQWKTEVDFRAAMEQAKADEKRMAELTNGYDPTKNQQEGMTGWDDFQAYLDRTKNQQQAQEKEKTIWDTILEGIGAIGSDTSLPGIGGSQVAAMSEEAQRNDTELAMPKDRWTDEERYRFGYLWNTERQKAWDYARAVNMAYAKQDESAKIQGIQASATDNFWAGAGHTLGALATSPLGMADYLKDLITYGAVGYVPQADGEVSPFEYSQAVTSGVANHLNDAGGTINDNIPVLGGKGWGDVYGLGTSIAQSSLAAYTGGSGQALITFFGSAAASGVDDALSRGADGAQALFYGTSVGAAEALAEMAGIDNLLKIGASAGKQLLFTLVKQAGAEGLEEGLTTFLGNVADQVWLGDKSNFYLRVQAYMSAGFNESEAKSKAWSELWGELAFDALGGFVSGAVHAGPQTAYHTFMQNSYAKNTYGGSQQELVGEALEINPDNAFAKKMQGRLDSGKNLSGGQLNALVQQNEATMAEQDMASIQKAAAQRLTELGATENVEATAAALAKQAAGQELSHKEKQLIKEYGSVVSQEMNPENIRSGKYNAEWAQKIGTNKINANEYSRALMDLAQEQTGAKLSRTNPAGQSQEIASAKGNLTTQGEIVSESHYEVSDDGQMVDTKTGNTIDPQGLVKAADGTYKIAAKDAEPVSTSDVSYADNNQALVYETFVNLEGNYGKTNKVIASMDLDSRNALLGMYSPEINKDGGAFAKAAVSAYFYGHQGIPFEAIAKDPLMSELTDQQRKIAWNQGRMVGMKATTDAQSDVDTVYAEAKKALEQTGAKKGAYHAVLDDGISPMQLNDKQRAVYSLADEIAQGVQTNIRVYDGNNKAQGFYNHATDEIWLNLNAAKTSREHIMAFTLAHELVHRAKKGSPAKYKAFTEFLMKEYGKQGSDIEAMIREQMDAAERFNKTVPKSKQVNMTREKALEEVVCDACSRMLLDTNAGQKLAEFGAQSRQNKSFLEDLKRWISEMLEKLRNYFRGVDPDSKAGREFAKFDESVKQILADMYVDMSIDAGEKLSTIKAAYGGAFAEKFLGAKDIQYNLAAVETHKDKLQKEYSEDSSTDLETIMKRYNKIIDIWTRLGGELKSNFLAEWNSKIGKDRTFTIFKAQAGYKYNVELSSMCKKGVPLFEAIDTIVKQEVMKELNLAVLGKAEKEILYDILKQHHFEIPCAICYVEQARQREGVIIDAFLNGKVEKNAKGETTKEKLGWNQVLDSIQKEMKANGVDYSFAQVSRDIATEKYSPADLSMDAKTQDAFYAALKKIANQEISRYNKAEGKSRKLLAEVTPEAVKECFKGTLPANLKIFKVLFEEPSSRFKITSDLLYSSVATQNLSMAHNKLYGLFNSQGGVSGYKTKQGTTIYWGDILGKSWKPDILRNEGGVRNQSNSDFQMYTLLDQAQMYIDFTAKGYYLQAYTKVLSELKLFGLSRGKINASLIPRVVVYLNADGTDVDVERTMATAGLDENGNPIYDDIEGINHNEAFMLIEDPEYSKSICGICIGYSDAHIRKLLDDSRVQQIIGFHDKTDDGTKRYKGARYAKNYNGLNEAVNKDGKTVHIGFNPYVKKAEKKFKFNAETESFEGTVNYNGKTYTADDIPKLAADLYLEMCAKKGYTPAYDDFKGHPNYYKLLADFGLYDSQGHYAPHRKVVYNMPDTVPYLDANGQKQTMKTYDYIKVELKKELAVRDSISEALADTSSEGIIPQFKAAVKKSQEEKSYSLPKVDADGNQLSADQMEFFKDSQVRWGENLMPVYHGTRKEFTVFDATKGYDENRVGGLLWAAKDSEYAEGFTSLYEPIIMKGYLNITNLLNVGDIDSYGNYDKRLQEIADLVKLTPSELEAMATYDDPVKYIYDITSSKGFRDRIVELGYDGIEAQESGLQTFGFVNSNQFKNIDNRNPTADPDIRYSLPKEDGSTYQEPAYEEWAVEAALYDALEHRDMGDDNLIRVGDMPRLVVDKIGIEGDFYIYRNHAYENMVSAEQAKKDTRFSAKAHYHDLGIEKMTDAIMALENPIMTIATKTKDGNPAVIMILPVDGKNKAPLYAVLSFYSDRKINGDYSRKPHIVLTISEREYFGNGSNRGYAEIVKQAVAEGRVIDFDKKMRDSLSVIANQARVGDITDASLDANLSHFRKEIKSFREKNHIDYKLPVGEDTSPRALLANAFEGIITNDIEKRRLQEYKGKVDMLNAEEQKLHALRAQIKKLSFAKGKRDTKKIKELQFDAIQTANRIATLDKVLLGMEAAAPLQNILKREKEMAYKRAEQKGKEALEAYKKAERERDAKWQSEVKEKYQASKKKAIETREKREAREKLQKLVLDTAKWISYPSKTDVKCPDILKQPYANFLNGIDLSSKRLADGGDPTKTDLRLANAMDSLATALERITDSQDPSRDPDQIANAVLDAGYLDLPAGFVKKLRGMTENVKKMMVEGEFVVNNMSAAEVRQLSQMIRTLNHAIKEVSRLYANLRFANVEALGDATMTFMDSLGEIEKSGGMKDFVEWDNALPYYAFKRFGNGGESIFEGLMDSQDKLAFLAQQIFDFQEKTWTEKEAKAWSEDTHTIELPSGNSLVLTTADAMSIYCLSRREQALPHLLGGGVRVIGIEKGSQKVKDSRSTLTIEDINAIHASLTDRQKKVAEALQEFMSTTCSEWGNEISMKRFLTKEFNEKFYFPIESNDENLPVRDPAAQQSDLFRLLNISATKPLTEGANNEVIVRNVFDVFTGHASDMARLNAYGMALLDYMKWLNYREKIAKENGQHTTRSVYKSMNQAYEKAAWSYALNLIKDVNGRASDNGDPTMLMKWMRNAKTASVGANLRVAALQFTSYPRAALVLSTRSITLGLTKVPQISKAKKYCGIALWKSFGFYDTNIARSIEDQMKGVTNIRQKIIELSLKGAEWGDAITWGCLWNACEYEVASTKKYKVGSEEFYQEVGKKLREVVYATQVVDSTLTRSQLMRSKRGMAQEAASFMSEPTLTANILMDARFQFEAEKRRTGSTKAAWKKAGPHIGRAVAVYSSVSLLGALVESLADALRDDDDEEFYKKFFEALPQNVLLNILPFNKVPIVSDIVELALSFFNIGFFSSEKLSTQWLSQTASAVDEWGDVFSGKSTATVYGALYKTVKALSSATGVPVSGAVREVATLWNNTAGSFNSAWKLRTYGQTQEDLRNGLYEAIVSGNQKQAESIRSEFRDRAKDEKEYQSSINSAIRKALRENDPRILKAAQAVMNGNGVERANIAREIAAEGHFDLQDIQAAINAEIDKLRKEAKGN